MGGTQHVNINITGFSESPPENEIVLRTMDKSMTSNQHGYNINDRHYIFTNKSMISKSMFIHN